MTMEFCFSRKHVLWVLINLICLSGYESCLEEERLGLLSIRDYFESSGVRTELAFPSWTDDLASDCCSWELVKCNSTTGRVIELFLNNTSLEPQQWFLNVSLFLPFEELHKLDLHGNGFSDCYQNHGFEKISILKKLEVLDLAENNFQNNILQSLGEITSLKTLNLSSNTFEGSFPLKDLARLKDLEILDLSRNHLNGSLAMLADLGQMTSLKALSLASNYLNGSLAPEGLCALKNLQELDLSGNNLSGIIPFCLGKLTSLRLLDLSSNILEGDISSFPITTLRFLEYIDLRNNLFWGQFSFYSITNHTKLGVLMLSSDNHKLEVQTDYSYDWLPTFQLKVIVMSNCRLNNIPHFLTRQTDLIVIDLSHNNLTGTFPNWLLENNTQLEFLSLRNNSFMGSFHLSSNSTFVIRYIDISNNHFHGKLQQNIGSIIPNVQIFNLSMNAIDGGIPFSIGSMPYLSYLDLSSNKFLGEIPNTLIANSSSLEILQLSNNGLSGQVPKTKSNKSSLLSLQLSENQFTGTLSNWISYYPSLGFLDISQNFISDEIPSFIGNLSLYHLNMADNVLEGTFLCGQSTSMLSFLDISFNHLSGTLPSCLKWSSNLVHLNLEGNRFTGTISEALLNSSSMMTLNIGNNFLFGEIPTSIGNLSYLRVLHLGGNNLSGLLLEELCLLKELAILDLSHNFLSGPIPSCFSCISFGRTSTFDLAQVGQLINEFFSLSYSYQSKLSDKLLPIKDTFTFSVQQPQVDLVTKTRSNIYKGRLLELMSGLDLSCNQLMGEMSVELGKLSSILTLNLSHNQLTGSIPRTWENLGQIESLDLSYNKLSGEIPSELISLHFLEVFSVAYNNFSGRLPDMKGQFSTFDNKSYEGNPFLCGPPLDTSCSTNLPESPPSFDASSGKWHDIIDPVSFLASFMATYIVFLLAFVFVLYVNPYWRRKLFLFIENFIDDFHFMVFYTIPKLFTRVIRKLYFA